MQRPRDDRSDSASVSFGGKPLIYTFHMWRMLIGRLFCVHMIDRWALANGRAGLGRGLFEQRTDPSEQRTDLFEQGTGLVDQNIRVRPDRVLLCSDRGHGVQTWVTGYELFEQRTDLFEQRTDLFKE